MRALFLVRDHPTCRGMVKNQWIYFITSNSGTRDFYNCRSVLFDHGWCQSNLKKRENGMIGLGFAGFQGTHFWANPESSLFGWPAPHSFSSTVIYTLCLDGEIPTCHLRSFTNQGWLHHALLMNFTLFCPSIPHVVFGRIPTRKMTIRQCLVCCISMFWRPCLKVTRRNWIVVSTYCQIPWRYIEIFLSHPKTS